MPVRRTGRRLDEIHSVTRAPHNFILASLNFVNTRFLIDTGASRSCISERYFHRVVPHALREKVLSKTQDANLLSASGSPLSVIGHADLDIRIHGYVIPQVFTVVRNLQHHCILGIDMLKSSKAVINIAEKALHLFDDLIVTPLISEQDENFVLRITRSVRVPPHNEAFLPVTLKYNTKYDFRTPAFTEAYPGLLHRGIGVAHGIVQPKTHQTVCQIINATSNTQFIRKGTPLAYLSPIDLSDPFNRDAFAGKQRERADFINNIAHHDPSLKSCDRLDATPLADKLTAISDTGLDITQAQKRLTATEFAQLVDLIFQYRHLFITDDSQLQRANLPEIHIPLTDNIPVRTKPYRLPPVLEAELNKQLCKLREAGILEDSTSPYSSSVFLVRKKDGNYRIVTDDRKINLKLLPLYYCLPSADTVVHKLGSAGSKFISSFDTKSAFLALPLAQQSRDLTSISSSQYHLRYTTLPLGLRTASILYQNQLVNLLQHLLSTEKALVYMDDVILFCSDLSTHLDLMRELFQRYDHARLRFNASKVRCFLKRYIILVSSSVRTLLLYNRIDAKFYKIVQHLGTYVRLEHT